MEKTDTDQKDKILTRFYSRPMVKTYFKLLDKDNQITKDTFRQVQGIAEEIKEDVSDLLHSYGLYEIYLSEETIINHETWWYQLYPLNSDDLDHYLPLFFKEFSLYPPTLIRNSKLKTIYFVGNLNFSTKGYTQYRAGIPDYCEETLAMVYCCKERRKDYIVNVIHHEIFHFIDHIMYGNIYRADAEWLSFNSSEFKYGNGGALNREWKPLDKDCVGFLNYYSTTGMEEDKAEIFSYLLNWPKKAKENTCEILGKKINAIKRMMKYFDEIGCNDDYWEWLYLFRENESSLVL
jgi:hypothetical protein